MENILGFLVGNTYSFIKDSCDFIRILRKRVEHDDIILNFDVVSLIIKISLNEEIQIIQESTDPQISKLGEVFLRSTFFIFQGVFYEKNIGVAMGSPLTPLLQTSSWKKLKRGSWKHTP